MATITETMHAAEIKRLESHLDAERKQRIQEQLDAEDLRVRVARLEHELKLTLSDRDSWRKAAEQEMSTCQQWQEKFAKSEGRVLALKDQVERKEKRIRKLRERSDRAFRELRNAEVELGEINGSDGMHVVGDLDPAQADSWPETLDDTDRACLADAWRHVCAALDIEQREVV